MFLLLGRITRVGAGSACELGLIEFYNIWFTMTDCSSSSLLKRKVELDFNGRNLENMKKQKLDYILPPMASGDVEEKNKKTVVLDLDQTLVHSLKLGGGGIPGRFDFIMDPEFDKVRHKRYVLKRPGVDELLQGLAISGAYEIVVFSSGRKDYVNTVVDKLLQELPPMEGIDNNMNIIPPTHRLCRDMCTAYRHPGETKIRHVKDLSLLGRDLRKVIIVDDNLLAFHRQPFNGIHIDCWMGDAEDNGLFRLLIFLKEIANSNVDVTNGMLMARFPIFPQFKPIIHLRPASTLTENV